MALGESAESDRIESLPFNNVYGRMGSVILNYSTLRDFRINKFKEVKLPKGKILSINCSNNFYIIFVQD